MRRFRQWLLGSEFRQLRAEVDWLLAHAVTTQLKKNRTSARQADVKVRRLP